MLHFISRHRGLLKFKYNQMYSNWIDIDTIITSMTLTYNVRIKVFTLDSEEEKILN